MANDHDYEALATEFGWHRDPEDGLWYALDVLDSETEIPGPFNTAREACIHDKLVEA